MTFSDGESIIRNLYADASDFVWKIDSEFTRSGETEYVRSDEELQTVVDEGKVKKDE